MKLAGQKNQGVEARNRKVFPARSGKILLAICIGAGLEGCQSASVAASSGTKSDPVPATSASPIQANGKAKAEAPVRPVAIAVPAGSVLRVRIDQELSTKYSRPGDRFTGVLEAPLVREGAVVVPKGAVVSGHVLTAHPSGRLKGRAVLSVTLDTCRVSGREVALSTSPLTRVSGSHRKRNWAWIGGGSGTGGLVGGLVAGPVGFVAGAASGAVAGTAGAVLTGKKEVSLPAESVVGFTLRSPLTAPINARVSFRS